MDRVSDDAEKDKLEQLYNKLKQARVNELKARKQKRKADNKKKGNPSKKKSASAPAASSAAAGGKNIPSRGAKKRIDRQAAKK